MRLRVAFFTLLVVSPLLLPLAAHAGIPFFGPIIPPTNPTCPLSWGSVIVVINNIIEFLLTIAIVFVAPIMIAYAGFLFVVNPMNPSGKEKAKGILLNTIVGIAIALAGWLIINAVLVALTGGGVSRWTALIGSKGAPPCLDQSGSISGAPTTPPPDIAVTPPKPALTPQCTISNANNVKTLAAAGIGVSSSGNCCDKNNRNCTSLDGMKDSTLSQVKNIQKVCGNVMVTGGTETGHSTIAGVSHSSGAKIDLATSIDGCIAKIQSIKPALTSTRTQIIRSDGARLWTDSCGNIYARETSPQHWDITVFRVCPL